VRAAAQFPRLHWGDYLRGDDVSAGGFPFLRRRGPLALIGLSSAVPTPPFMATGRLGGTQLARLAEVLDRCASERLFRVVLIHHPPVSAPRRHFKRLVDGAEFRATLARHGAELVIHGHDHERASIYLDGPKRRIPVAGAPSASEAPPGKHDPAGYNLYRIEDSGGGWRCEAIARGLSPGGETVIETGRMMLGD
jgi:3',5'-cyclic AMP phosphodiesterase CpdA